jgi:Spy/CpxP family protein refolding chaperone
MRSNWLMGAAGAVLALVVVVLLGAGMAESKEGRGCHGHDKGAHFDRMEQKLGELQLDEQTRAAAQQVIATAKSESEARHEELADARRALHDLLEQDAPAVDAVMAQADAVGALQTESHKAKLRTMLELRSLLGPDQWSELKGSFHHHGRGKRMEKS